MPNLTIDPQTDPLSSSENITAKPSPHNFSKSILIGILIFILLSFTAYGAFRYGQIVATTKVTPETFSSTEKVSPFRKTLSSSPSSVPVDEAANWKTYSNHRFNFSFKYPSDFKMDETIGGDDSAFRVGFTNGQTKDAEGNYRGIEKDKMAVYVHVSGKEFITTHYRYGGYEWTRSVIELLSKAGNGARMSHNNGDTTDNVDNETVTKIGDVNIDGFVGVKYKSEPTVAERSATIDVALIRGDRTYLVTALTGDDSLLFTRQYSDTLDQILSTFKFLP